MLSPRCNDINKEKTDALAAAYGAESMESVDALIASDKVDAIVITAWDGVHAEMTNKAIAAGKPVFCEKPLATTKADCAEIVRIEQAAGRNLVQVGFMRRYDPDYRKIKAILDSGELGRAADGALHQPHAAHRSRIYQRHAGN